MDQKLQELAETVTGALAGAVTGMRSILANSQSRRLRPTS